MNRKSILMASAVAVGLAFGGPALANGKGGGYNDHGKGKGTEIEQKQGQAQGQAQGQQQGQAQAQATDVDVDQDQKNNQILTLVQDDDYFVDIDVDEDKVIANQTLSGVIVNYGFDEIVDVEDGDYETGDNDIGGGAFAAFAGILSQSWNTGTNANTQAATNVAARGTVHFGNAEGTSD